MVEAILSILVFANGSPAIAQQDRAQTETVLTNEAVVKMVKAGLGTKLIIQMIETQPGKYSLTSDSLIRLKEQAVTDAVLSAMIEEVKASTTATNKERPGASAPHPPPTERSEIAEGVWEMVDVTDRMSDAKSFNALMWQSAMVGSEIEGKLQVQATCNPEKLDFKIGFFSNRDSTVGFKQNAYGDTVVPGGLLGVLTVAGRHQKPWVEMQVRMDRHPPASVSSEEDYINYASVFFAGRSVKGAMAAVDSPQGGTNQQLANFARLYAATQSAGTIDQALKASSILVQLTLADNHNVILEIRPQDPSFKQFAARCSVDGSATQRLAERPTEFTGTVDEFATRLPRVIQRVALENGLDPDNYGKEAAYIIGIAHTCATITPQMARTVTSEYGQEVLSKLGSQYDACVFTGIASASDKVKTWDKTAQRGVGFFVDARGRWQDGEGFTIRVVFYGMNLKPIHILSSTIKKP